MRWAEPTPCRALGAAAPLTDEQVRSWRERGFAHVGGLFDPQTIADAVALYGAEFEPDPSGSQGQRQLGGGGSRGSDGPLSPFDFDNDGRAPGGRLEFPTPLASLNHMTLHPRVIAACAQLTGLPAERLRLLMSHVFAKGGVSPPPRPARRTSTTTSTASASTPTSAR